MDTQTRVGAAKARLEANRNELAQTRRFGPPCTDCRYRRDTGLKGVIRCAHLALVKQSFKITTGEINHQILTTVDEARAADGLCGPEAILFERKSRLVKFAGTPFGFVTLLAGGGLVVAAIGDLLGY